MTLQRPRVDAPGPLGAVGEGICPDSGHGVEAAVCGDLVADGVCPACEGGGERGLGLAGGVSGATGVSGDAVVVTVAGSGFVAAAGGWVDGDVAPGADG
nr:MAG TPA: hypothetical protein [Caudoviricetes sp.]